MAYKLLSFNSNAKNNPRMPFVTGYLPLVLVYLRHYFQTRCTKSNWAAGEPFLSTFYEYSSPLIPDSLWSWTVGAFIPSFGSFFLTLAVIAIGQYHHLEEILYDVFLPTALS